MSFDVPCQQLRTGTIPPAYGLGAANRFLALDFKPKVWIAFNTESSTFGFPGTWGPVNGDNQEGDSFGFATSLTEQYGVANMGYGSSQNLGRHHLPPPELSNE